MSVADQYSDFFYEASNFALPQLYTFFSTALYDVTFAFPIRAMDPDPHSFSLLNPDTGGNKMRKKLKKCKEIRSNCQNIFKKIK